MSPIKQNVVSILIFQVFAASELGMLDLMFDFISEGIACSISMAM